MISDAATALGLDPGRMYVLAEVKECGGEEWVLEAGDIPAQRFLLWPRKAQEQHPQSLGFYFLLQVGLIAHCLLCCQTGCRVKIPSSVTIACYFILFQEGVRGENRSLRIFSVFRDHFEKKNINLNVYFSLPVPIQERNNDGTIRYVHLPSVTKEQEAQQLAARGFLPPPQDDFADLCNLPVLSEDSILNNLQTRFYKKKIYTYAGSILIAINPFKFLPIYNPKYVKMYENHQLGKLEPHIFAIADVAYYAMLRKRVNQCIVISGESGSGKTQSTNFLIHCLTALSQKGYASGVERTILGAGPVLEVRCQHM